MLSKAKFTYCMSNEFTPVFQSVIHWWIMKYPVRVTHITVTHKNEKDWSTYLSCSYDLANVLGLCLKNNPVVLLPCISLTILLQYGIKRCIRHNNNYSWGNQVRPAIRVGIKGSLSLPSFYAVIFSLWPIWLFLPVW